MLISVTGFHICGATRQAQNRSFLRKTSRFWGKLFDRSYGLLLRCPFFLCDHLWASIDMWKLTNCNGFRLTSRLHTRYENLCPPAEASSSVVRFFRWLVIQKLHCTWILSSSISLYTEHSRAPRRYVQRPTRSECALHVSKIISKTFFIATPRSAV